ncbi:MAG: SPOR domain-containing protein [Candidatus Berkiellales bacterium]
MTKDYAKRRRLHHPVKSRSRFPSRGNRGREPILLPPWAWLGAGLILGLGFSAMTYWKLHHQKPAPSRPEVVINIEEEGTPSSKNKSAKHKHKQKTVANAEEKSSRFDFYRLLPNLSSENSNEAPLETAENTKTTNVTAEAEHEVDDHPDATPFSAATEPASLDPTSVANQEPENDSPTARYIIQAGSFRHFSQADKLRAELALAGFEARIQTYKLGPRENWYRVYIGPYEAKTEADASLQKLEQAQRLHGLILKMKV